MEKSEIIELKRKFAALGQPDKIYFIKMVLTPQMKKKFFFDALKRVRSTFKKALTDPGREKLIKETIRYAKNRN